MNKSKLKSYAPQARKDFIAAVTARANLLGLSDKSGDKTGTLEVAPAQTQGDVTVIAGQAWPAKVSTQRDQLIERIHKDGFAHTMEAVAYTWFNRFAALRYMELHDYLGHGHFQRASLVACFVTGFVRNAQQVGAGGDCGDEVFAGLGGVGLEVGLVHGCDSIGFIGQIGVQPSNRQREKL